MKLFVVVGLGQFGRHTAKTLYEGGGDVLAIDKDENRVERIKEEVGQAVCADATDVDVLRSLGVDKADAGILALGEEDLEASVLVCTALSDLGVGRLIVRAATEIHGKILTRMGATKVIYPEKQMGEQLAYSILATSVLEQTMLPTGQIVAHILPKKEIIGKTLNDLQIRDRYRLSVIGIQRAKRHIDDKGNLNEELVLKSIPSMEEIVLEDDILVVVGQREQIENLSRKD